MYTTVSRGVGGSCGVRDSKREPGSDPRSLPEDGLLSQEGGLLRIFRKELNDADITRIADTYHAWRGEPKTGKYEDVPGFCKSASLEDIRQHGHVLTPGRYVGAEETEDDDEPFPERFATLKARLEEQFAQGNRLTAAIRAKLTGVVS
jgi:type I restriction enzyme M protein